MDIANDPLTEVLRRAADGDKEAEQQFWQMRRERVRAHRELTRAGHRAARRMLGLDPDGGAP